MPDEEGAGTGNAYGIVPINVKGLITAPLNGPFVDFECPASSMNVVVTFGIIDLVTFIMIRSMFLVGAVIVIILRGLAQFDKMKTVNSH